MDAHQIDAIRDDWQHTASGEELPEQDQLIEVEETLLIRLPRALREFLLHLSDLQPPGWELCTCHDPQLYSYLSDVCAECWDQGVPRDLIPVAFNATQYALMNDGGEVLIWHRGLGDLTEERSDLMDWIENDWI